MKKIPLRRLHKPSGQDRVRYRGRDLYFGKHCSPESDRRYNAWLSQLLAGITDPPTRLETLTVVELVERFLGMAKSRYSSGEFHNLKQAMRAVLAKHRHTYIASFGPRALIDVRSWMIERNWPRRRINEQVGRIRRMFRWGVSQEMVHIHTVLALRELLPLRAGEIHDGRMLPESSAVRPATDSQIDAVLEQLAPTLRAMVSVHRLTGMRPGELFIMRPIDIDRSGKVWIYRPAKYKQQWAGKSLGYAIGPRAQHILESFLDRPEREFLFKPSQTVKERRVIRAAARKTNLQPSQLARSANAPGRAISECYNRTSYRNALARAVRRIAKGDSEAFAALYFAPNQVRHTKATALRAEHGIESARIALGHSDITTTLVYAEADLEKAKQIAWASG